MKSKIVLIGLVLLFSVSSFSQHTQTVRGVVVDVQSQSPLPGANIILENSEPLVGTGTNGEGEFRLTEIPVGLQNFRVTMVGYEPVYLRNIQVNSGKEIILKIEMEEKINQIQEIVVKSYDKKAQPLNEMANVSARSFTVAETERYAGTWFDPSRMAANYAGVSAAGDQRNDIIIRGNSSLGLLWRLEGIDIPNPNHFGTLGSTGGPISILNNNLLTNSDFFTGAFPAEYGNAMAGVFDLQMRSGNNEKREYTAQVSMNGLELGIEGPFSTNSKASYLANYRYSTLALFDMFDINFGVSGVPQYQDLSFKINVPGTKAGKFTMFGVGGTSYIEVLSKDRDADDWTFGKDNLDFTFGSDMGVVGLSHLYFINKNARLKTSLSVSATRSSAKIDSSFFDKPSKIYYGDKSSEIRYSLSSKYTHKFNAKNTFNAGYNFELYQVHYEDSFLLPDDNFRKLSQANDENMFLLQAYSQLQHKFTQNLSVYGGIHYQHFTLNNTYSLEPRASFKWNFIPKHSLSFGAGVHSQLQPRLVYFMETPLPDGSVSYTNKNLDFSKSNQFVLSYDYLISKDIRIKTEAYYQYLYQIPVEQKNSHYSAINYGTKFFLERVDSLTNTGTGQNYGLEFTFEKFLSNNYYILITASLFDSKYTGSDNIKRNTIYNGNYVVNFLTGYTFDIGKNSALSIDFKTVFAGGKRYIPVNMYASELAGKEVLDFTQAYDPQYNPYFRLDGRISYKMNFSKCNMEVAFDIQNLTKQENILLQTYDPTTNSIRNDYQLGMFYIFLIRVQF